MTSSRCLVFEISKIFASLRWCNYLYTMTEFEYWLLGTMIGLDLLMVWAFVRLHTTPKIMDGYAGEDRILNDQEIDKLVSHLLAESSLIILSTMTFLEPMLYKYLNYKYEDTTKLIFGATFCGSVAYAIAKHTMKSKVKAPSNPPQQT